MEYIINFLVYFFLFTGFFKTIDFIYGEEFELWKF